MAVSQNGWPVVGPDKIDNTPINGHKYPNGFLKGDVYKAFVWLFTQLNNRVEKVAEGNPPDEWGYFVKNIEGGNSISNHSSGTAGDYNASQHGVGERDTYNATQRAEIREILREADGIFRWGGDYTGRRDDMHFEINKGRAAVAAFIEKIERQNDMTVAEFLAALESTRGQNALERGAGVGVHNQELFRTDKNFAAFVLDTNTRVAAMEKTLAEILAKVSGL